MRIVLLFAMSVASILNAQQTESSEFVTGGEMVNGRAWETFPEPVKNIFVAAVYNELRFDLVDDRNELEKRWAKGFMVGDYVKELNALYQDRENIRIPAVILIRHCTLKLQGQTTKERLEKNLTFLRTLVAFVN